MKVALYPPDRIFPAEIDLFPGKYTPEMAQFSTYTSNGTFAPPRHEPRRL
jgi:hypothetical protein